MAQQSEFNGLTEDEIISAIEGGKSIARIAAELGVNRSTLSRWLRADEQRSARAREARELSADAYDEAAEDAITTAADPFELAKAKEMAHHLRWRASKIAPRRYGEKLQLGGAEDLPPLQGLADEQLLRRAAELLGKASATGEGNTD